MNLIVNVNPLVAPLSGIGHYTAHLLGEWLESPRLTTLAGFDYKKTYDAAALRRRLTAALAPASATNASAYSWRQVLKASVKRLPMARQVYDWCNQRRIAAWLDRAHAVYWEPNYHRIPCRAPSIVTIHDLSHREYPDYHPRERVAWLDRVLCSSVAAADHLVVVSEFTRQALIAAYHVDPCKISIIPPGINPGFEVLPDEMITATRARYDLQRPYVIALGTLEPRKNWPNLLKAFQVLPDSLKRHYQLVLIGAKGWQMHTLSASIDAVRQEGWLNILGYVSQTDLPFLLAGARCLAYPSLYEGFGMPVIEAMACGVPVLTSHVTALPETAGGAAYLVDPTDYYAIAQGLTALLEDDLLCAKLRARGLQRAKAFSWAYSANKLLDIAEQLA